MRINRPKSKSKAPHHITLPPFSCLSLWPTLPHSLSIYPSASFFPSPPLLLVLFLLYLLLVMVDGRRRWIKACSSLAVKSNEVDVKVTSASFDPIAEGLEIPIDMKV